MFARVSGLAFRSVARSALRQSVARPSALRPAFALPSKSVRSVRFASSSNENDLPDEDVLKVQDVVSKVQQHPHIRELLNEFQEIIVKKGFNPQEPPSITQVMRLFADKEVRELISKLKDAFEEAGIKISADDMGLFMKMFKQ